MGQITVYRKLPKKAVKKWFKYWIKCPPKNCWALKSVVSLISGFDVHFISKLLCLVKCCFC